MKQPIRVVLVDDHTIMREGLKKILSTDAKSRFEVVGTFSDGQAFLDYLKTNTCDVALMDIQMPKNREIVPWKFLQNCIRMFRLWSSA